jgi:hypothetical protein
VYRLTDQGDEFASSIEEIESEFESNGIVHFLMWADATRQLYVHFQKLSNDLHCEEYEFSALRDSPMLGLLEQSMFEMFGQARVANAAVAMIIDAHGHTEDFDWDPFLLGNSEIPGDLPDYLALPADRAELLRSTFEGFEETKDGFWVYKRSDWRAPKRSPERFI